MRAYNSERDNRRSLKNSSNQNDPKIQYEIGQSYYREKNHYQAKQWLLKSFINGYKKAEHTLNLINKKDKPSTFFSRASSYFKGDLKKSSTNMPVRKKIEPKIVFNANIQQIEKDNLKNSRAHIIDDGSYNNHSQKSIPLTIKRKETNKIKTEIKFKNIESQNIISNFNYGIETDEKFYLDIKKYINGVILEKSKKIISLQNQKKDLLNVLKNYKQLSSSYNQIKLNLNSVFIGNKGTGKTFFTQFMAHVFYQNNISNSSEVHECDLEKSINMSELDCEKFLDFYSVNAIGKVVLLKNIEKLANNHNNKNYKLVLQKIFEYQSLKNAPISWIIHITEDQWNHLPEKKSINFIFKNQSKFLKFKLSELLLLYKQNIDNINNDSHKIYRHIQNLYSNDENYNAHNIMDLINKNII